MVRHFNPSIVENAKRLFASKHEHISDEILPNIQPTIEIVPRTNIVRGTTLTSATSANIFTTPTDKDFYLTSVNLSFIKDANSTMNNMQISVTVDGDTNIPIVAFPGITLTAASDSTRMVYVPAVKVDRGTAILIQTNSAVGIHVGKGSITGYTIETTEGD